MPGTASQPVHAQRDGDAAPVPGDLAHGSEVDAQQHGHDHEPPDEHRYRNIDLGQAHVAQQVERPGHGTAERHACHDAQGNP
jgi:hypothetical protein